MIQAGKLDKKITIQQLVAASPQQNATGEPDATWSALYSNIWGQWVTLNGNALFLAQEHSSEVRGIWRIRWRDGITASMRITHDGLIYNILYVPPYDKSGDKRQMDLEVSEGLNAG